MFSSPSRGTPRRNVGGGPSSVRSATPVGRASTPTLVKHASHAYRRRGESVLSSNVMSDAPGVRRERAHMEMDEGTVLSRDEMHAVTAWCRLPAEVVAAVQKMGVYRPCLSVLDAQTGFAYLATADRCYVWSFASRGLDSPPCYSFSISSTSPSTSSIVSPTLPFCSLIARGGDREPGLLIVAHTGDARFCDNVASSLSGERMTKFGIPLGSGENASQLHRCGANLYLVATTQSRLFSIRFITAGGSLQAQVSPFTQSRGLFGRLFGTASQLGSTRGVISLASRLADEHSGAYEVYAMGQSVLQKWSVVEGGSEKLLAEEDLKQLLLNYLGNDINAPIAADSFALIDIALTSDGAAAVLFCYAPTPNGLLKYKVTFIESSASAPSFAATFSFTLEYTRYPDSRPYSAPRLLLPFGGPVAFIVFPEAVVIRLVHGEHFEDTIEMRDVTGNRIIGTGAEGPDVEAPAGISSLSVVTAVSGALLVEVDSQRAQDLDLQLSSGPDTLQVLTRQLKSRIERAVFHSDDVQNPISFDLPQDIRGNLIAAVDQLSNEIVQSDAPGLSHTVDLRVQLGDRLEKLHGLASYLASNGKLGLLSQNALRRLCADAELVAAAIDVWDYQNNALALNLGREATGDPLGSAIRAIIESLPDAGWEGDVIRFFFRQRLRHLDDVLARLPSSIDQTGSQEKKSAWVLRVNQIFLAAFQAAHRYRAEAAHLYHLDPAHISLEAWTCASRNIQSLRQQFQHTIDVLHEYGRHRDTAMEDEESAAGGAEETTLRGQLCDLASCLLDAFAERVAYLNVARASNSSLEKEARLLEDDFRAARLHVILSLVDIGRSERAFSLAEKHKDFAVLTQLCCAMQGNNRAVRTRSYLDKYQDAFAFALYDYYVQQGWLTKLLEEEEDYHGLLGDFLRSRGEYNRIAWLHDIHLKQWDVASARLREEAVAEKEQVTSKKLMLSLHKLCHVAQLQESDIASELEQTRIESIDDQLDLVNVHQSICRELQESVTEGESSDIDETLRQTTEMLGSISPALQTLYCSLARRLVDGAVLSSEDLLDLLTLPDGSEQSVEHYKTAIEVFVRAKDIPSARVSETLATLWRRVLLHDDWLAMRDNSQSTTSDEGLMARLKSTALYQTLLNASENQATAQTILNPSDYLMPPSRESIQARLRDEDDGSVDDVLRDCLAQVKRATEIVEAGLARGWFDDVMRLLQDARETEQIGQVIDDEDSQFMTLY